jgi:CubicO group peptidase (beta-lactamase class C family)
MRGRHSIIALALSLAVSLSALPPPTGQAADLGAPGPGSRLNAYFTGLAAQHTFSGVVLVARHDTILLSKGFGLADQAHNLSNTPLTRFPIGGVTSSFSLLGTLWLEEHGKIMDSAPICRYLAVCPAAWKPITVHMLLDGTANLPNLNWEKAGATLAQSMKQLEGQPLDGTPGSGIDYQNAENLVEGAIIEQVTGKPWETFLRQVIFAPAGMKNSGRVTDAMLPPARAQDYSGAVANPIAGYDDYYAAYSTAADVYAYDNALFAGKLVSAKALARLFTPRAAITPGDPGVSDLRVANKWKIGRVFGHQAIYTNDSMYSFSAINMRFPQDDMTIVVVSNDSRNDIEGIATQTAADVFGVMARLTPSAAAPAATAVPSATPAMPAISPTIANYAVKAYVSSAFRMSLEYPVAWTQNLASSPDIWGDGATFLSPTTLDILAPDGTDGFDVMAGPNTLSVADLIALGKQSSASYGIVADTEHASSDVIDGVTFQGFEVNVPPGVAGPGEAHQRTMFAKRGKFTYQVAYSILIHKSDAALVSVQLERMLRSITFQ